MERMLLAVNGVAALRRPAASVSSAQLQRRPEGGGKLGGGSMMGRPAAWGVVAVAGHRRPVLNWIKGRHPARCTCARRWARAKPLEAKGVRKEEKAPGESARWAAVVMMRERWRPAKDQAGGES